MAETRTDTKPEIKENERLDDLQISGLFIIQDTKRFCFGMDAVLLSGFVSVKDGAKVLDMGTGTRILPLLLSAKTKASKLTGLEIQPESADMARRSVEYNKSVLQDRVEIVEGDIKEAGGIFGPASFDVITCNPPYMKKGNGLVNPDEALAIARHELMCTFEDVARESAKLLTPGGKLFVVHKPERLSELLCTLTKYRLEPKRVRVVYPYVDKEPEMVLIEAAKGGKSGMKMEKPLIIFEKSGEYTEEIKRDYRF